MGTHEVRLPPGPVFMSPDRLLYSINREVILRKPEQFKVACLNDIKDLFGDRDCPFYAGFGNRNSVRILLKKRGEGKGEGEGEGNGEGFGEGNRVLLG